MNENMIIKKAYAKTNLFLRTVGKRPDSFTEIETVFLPVTAVRDSLAFSFEKSPGISIRCTDDSVPCDNRNLCWKAAEKYYEKACLKNKGISIDLEKGNPVAAGMGGGSSDAAVTLLAMQEYYQCLPEEELFSLALSIGSDVPFFLKNTPCSATGRGEKLTPLSIKKTIHFPLLFAAPGFPVSAKWAYSHINWTSLEEAPVLSDAVKGVEEGDILLLKNSLRNDLQKALLKKFPLLEMIFSRFRSYGGTPLVSGSGPTVFALFEDEKAREKMFEKEKEYFSSANIRFFKG
ncbi:MAG: 4-(cytidine 5'-diphospho)-2-C-methyl-D-erythritol kinase [Lentisphaeria bacterium]|nr:4-(cytidine 5'-diphospho)-2-C-methyl-D-erythritol kinase [Lentisphaeria bacterium]